MMDELIKRLRNRRICIQQSGGLEDFPLLCEAADAIAELSKREADMAHNMSALSLKVLRVEEKIPRWIPVTERLPPVDKEVLVVAYGSMMRIWNIHRLDPETADVCWECEDGTFDDVCVVTHWMPLPPMPDSEAIVKEARPCDSCDYKDEFTVNYPCKKCEHREQKEES